MRSTFFVAGILATTALACPDLQYHSHGVQKRADVTGTSWSYVNANTWGLLSTDYASCQDGTHQSPIGLRLDQGFAPAPRFEGNEQNVTGIFANWNYGPSMTLQHPEGNFSTLPRLSFTEGDKSETVFMSAWHIHAPGEHTVDGRRSKAEMHLVHVTAEGKPRAVLALRIDPGTEDSEFFKQLPPLIGHDEHDKHVDATMNVGLALAEVDYFKRAWTYGGEYTTFRRDCAYTSLGSLTTPPCTEGIRFFVARDTLFVSDAQMVALLRASQYSARPEQQVWQHRVNVL
jgi:carbonic anhydrase